MSVDDRIQNAVERRIVENPGDTDLLIYDNFGTIPAFKFIFNSSFWGTGFDFTGVGSKLSGGLLTFAATLISRRHVLSAEHTSITTGDVLYFIGSNGGYYSTTIINTESFGEDHEIGELDSDVPTNLIHYKVLPADFDEHLTYDATDFAGVSAPTVPTGLSGKPVVYLDRERKAKIGCHRIITDGAGLPPLVGTIIKYGTKYVDRQDYWELQIAGDSGSPHFCYIDGELVLLGCTFGVQTYNWISNQDIIDGINAAMLTVDSDGTGYQLTEYEFSETAPPPEFFPTQKHRMAVVGVGRPWIRSKFPDSSKDYAWRATTGLTYGQNRTLAADPGFIFTMPDNKPHFSVIENFPLFEMPINKPHFDVIEE